MKLIRYFRGDILFLTFYVVLSVLGVQYDGFIKVFSTGTDDECVRIISEHNGDFYLFCNTEAFPKSQYSNILVMKVDRFGENIIWAKSIGDTSSSGIMRSGAILSDGHILLSAITGKPPFSLAVLMKLSSVNGSLFWWVKSSITLPYSAEIIVNGNRDNFIASGNGIYRTFKKCLLFHEFFNNGTYIRTFHFGWNDNDLLQSLYRSDDGLYVTSYNAYNNLVFKLSFDFEIIGNVFFFERDTLTFLSITPLNSSSSTDSIDFMITTRTTTPYRFGFVRMGITSSFDSVDMKTAVTISPGSKTMTVNNYRSITQIFDVEESCNATDGLFMMTGWYRDGSNAYRPAFVKICGNGTVITSKFISDTNKASLRQIDDVHFDPNSLSFFVVGTRVSVNEDNEEHSFFAKLESYKSSIHSPYSSCHFKDIPDIYINSYSFDSIGIASTPTTGFIYLEWDVPSFSFYSTPGLKFSDFCFQCYGKDMDAPHVCSENGVCNNWNNCSCKEKYYGDECQEFSCFGILESDTENVCNGHGRCVEKDECRCDFGYFSIHDNSACEFWWCGEFLKNDTINVCNGHGNCSSSHSCSCDHDFGYSGNLCQDFYCGSSYWKDSKGCNGHGQCIASQKCSCDFGYSGELCAEWTCKNISKFNVGSICSGHGTCISHDLCVCDVGYSDRDCDIFFCGDYMSNDTLEVCNKGKGNCSTSQKCECDFGYSGSMCSVFSCLGYLHYDREVCSKHGICSDLNNCSCFDEYFGVNCDDFYCFSKTRDSSDVCNGKNGHCIGANHCDCNPGYSGSECNEFFCNEYYMTDPLVCNQHGKCIGHRICECDYGYSGKDCESFSCGGEDEDKKKKADCSDHGKCIEHNKCICDFGYSGELCSDSTGMLATVLIPVGSSIGFIVLICIFLLCFCLFILCLTAIFLCLCLICIGIGSGIISYNQRKKLTRFLQLDDFELILQEQLLEKDASVAHIRVNKRLFEINYDDVKIIRMIGKGGSGAIVFLARFSGNEVAFKCFKTQLLCESQTFFNEFEKEVELLASLNHPYVIRFFGATLNPPRVGIIMEYCVNGEILDFIITYREKQKDTKKRYPFREKLRMLYEISNALEYVHSKSIIHRDLKCENVLVDSQEHIKLMDFGVSRILAKDTQAHTKRVGTNIYMAPEVLEGVYNEKIDSFSFAILAFIVLSENEDPYGSEQPNQNIEYKVKMDANYRPNLNEIRICVDEKNDDNVILEKWMRELISTCWEANPQLRYSSREISSMLKSKLKEL